ncbi:MAG: primosomal protein N' [Anaerolineales bacterium]|jgi:primosomal protein N' (replication factor Y)|nr:primosomal protein N' [Anaerolineales bacterium]MBX3005467.1 primosomal protein N' [Anaerolineales bacterium]MCW5839111.1 primosomal protein N' [Anaerolineales bacterium]
MPEYVELAVNVPKVSGVFHYHVPAELRGRLHPGHLVLAPFGAQVVQGVVLRAVEQPEVTETKAIDSLLDDEPVLTPQQIELARQLSHSTLAPLAACVALMLPPGIGQLADVRYRRTQIPAPELSAAQALLLHTLEARGPLRARQLDKALPRRNWRAALRALQGHGLIATEPVLPMPRQKAKLVRTARLLALPPAGAQLGKTAAVHARRAALLDALQRESGHMPTEWLFAESGAALPDLAYLEKQGYVELGQAEHLRDPLEGLQTVMDVPHTLTAAQERAWQAVQSSLNAKNAKPILLHGVTSSGKTEIYLRAVAQALQAGRTALVLVPEIALTPQTVQRFFARFGDTVGLLHSELSDGERYDTWRRVRRGDLSVVVGPRSALFAPLQNIGLIVLDEEHDDSYYEANQDVHYHARRAALDYAKTHQALVLLGSATPDVGSYTQARAGHWQLLELPERVQAHRGHGAADIAPELPPVEIVDMRRELKAGNRSIFSRTLRNQLEQVVQRGQQAILFLNRRGSATYVFCRDCGYVLRCPNCETPLTQHARGELTHDLVCHQCGYHRASPKQCPQCESSQIRHYGMGTESVVAEVSRLLPEARVLRWDRDSTRSKGSHQRILAQFADGHADVLVGTQMLTKGLDLPKVTLVGVVLADVGLQMPDYRAPERVFQLLTQVAGRAGRSALGGNVIFQTFQPEHYAIQAAAAHDYATFYETESAYRRQLRYPPYAELVRLEYRHLDERKAGHEASALAAELHAQITRQGRGATDVIGPAPSFYARVNKEYRWQLMLRGIQPVELLRGLRLPGWRIEVNPPAPL